jgi:hypothetical protein
MGPTENRRILLCLMAGVSAVSAAAFLDWITCELMAVSGEMVRQAAIADAAVIASGIMGTMAMRRPKK